MIHLREIATESGIYTFHDKDGHVLYVGKANNLRARLRQHEANNELVKSWISFFDQEFEKLNIRIKKAFEQADFPTLRGGNTFRRTISRPSHQNAHYTDA
jgi:hypothetical protein